MVSLKAEEEEDNNLNNGNLNNSGNPNMDNEALMKLMKYEIVGNFITMLCKFY